MSADERIARVGQASPAVVSGGDDLATLRHDLRTPLNHIIGYSEMLIEEAADKGAGSMLGDLQKIHQAARNLHEMVGRHLAPGRVRLVAPDEAAAGAPAMPAVRRAISDAAEKGPSAAAPRGEGHLLVVDDNEMNRDMLSRRLERQGYTVTTAADGLEALEAVARESFDLVLLDIMMPGLDGHGVLARLKADPELRHLPVIMISALDEMQSVVRCIEAGAEDYLPKPFDPTLLRARIGATLEKKRLRDQEQRTHRALVESQAELAGELAKAAAYVTSLLPARLAGPVRSDWRFIPSMQLGGDTFGYHWLDDGRLVLYLIDVCGHGVGAALLSISVMNVLRSQSLPSTDFADPAVVLTALNERFPAEAQNNMNFTIWYGVYDRIARELTYASGGHPPAVLVMPGAAEAVGGAPAVDGESFVGGAEGAGGAQVAELCTPNFMVGIFPGVQYESARCSVPEGSRLFVFSDGAYEVATPSDEFLDFGRFKRTLAGLPDPTGRGLDDVLAEIRGFQQREAFDDDCSIMAFEF